MSKPEELLRTFSALLVPGSRAISAKAALVQVKAKTRADEYSAFISLCVVHCVLFRSLLNALFNVCYLIYPIRATPFHAPSL